MAVLLISAALVPSAVSVSDGSNVSINITKTTRVTVQPNLFNFSDMQIKETNFSDTADHQLIIENAGSTNLTNIYIHLDTLQSEQDNPLGSGQASEYAAGRFIWIRNKSSRFYLAGSLTWNRSEAAGGKPSGITDADNFAKSWGFYKNTTGNYLWSLGGNGSQGALEVGEPDLSQSYCNATGEDPPDMYIKNETDSGSNRDLTQNSVQYTFNTVSGDWGVHRATQGPLKGHYIAVYWDCTKAYIYRFDASDTFPSSGSSDQYVVGGLLAPGEEYSGLIGAAVPDGIPAGVTNRTLLTVHASVG